MPRTLGFVDPAFLKSHSDGESPLSEPTIMKRKRIRKLEKKLKDSIENEEVEVVEDNERPPTKISNGLSERIERRKHWLLEQERRGDRRTLQRR